MFALPRPPSDAFRCRPLASRLVMEKALIGLVACEKERHTAANIKKWTNEALLDIGLTAKDLVLVDVRV